MGSVTSCDDSCRCCGENAMDNTFFYKTGEEYEACPVCGYFADFSMLRNAGENPVRKRFCIPLSRVRIQIIGRKAGKYISEYRLPPDITSEELNLIGWGDEKAWWPILQKYKMDTGLDLRSRYRIKLGYYPKRDKHRFHRMNYIGNRFEMARTKNPRTVVFYQAKFKLVKRLSYGAVCVEFFGKKKPFFKCFRSKPKYSKLIKKWNRLTASDYDAEHSYLMVVENGEAKYLKGKLNNFLRYGQAP